MTAYINSYQQVESYVEFRLVHVWRNMWICVNLMVYDMNWIESSLAVCVWVSVCARELVLHNAI